MCLIIDWSVAGWTCSQWASYWFIFSDLLKTAGRGLGEFILLVQWPTDQESKQWNFTKQTRWQELKFLNKSLSHLFISTPDFHNNNNNNDDGDTVQYSGVMCWYVCVFSWCRNPVERESQSKGDIVFFVPQLIFEKEGVYLHTNAKRTSEETSIPGFIRIVERVRKTRTFGSVHVLLSALSTVVNTFSQILSSLYP